MTQSQKETPKTQALALQAPATTFRDVRSWQDCVGRIVLLWHPDLALFHAEGPRGPFRAKVLHVDLVLGTVLVQISTEALKGRYLLPVDHAVVKVR
jgi:hypothetical protein